MTQKKSDIATLSRDELEIFLDQLEDRLNGIGDDIQRTNVDLQSMLQRQQDIMENMLNVSKLSYEATMAIIRKIGG